METVEPVDSTAPAPSLTEWAAAMGAGGEEPKEVNLDTVDGVVCEVVYALDKQLDWIAKNMQPGTKRVQARLWAEELAMKNGDNERVVEARPVRVSPRPLMDPPARVARGAGPGADQEDFALREWLRCSFGMCMRERDVFA